MKQPEKQSKGDRRKRSREDKLIRMLTQVQMIISRARYAQRALKDQLSQVHERFRLSAINLVHYRILRTFDIRKLQRQLGYMGLSRFARSQGHVMTALRINRSFLRALIKQKPLKLKQRKLSIKAGEKALRRNAKALLGYRSKGRRTRIMVTMPSEAATDTALVQRMMAAGMNCARINCAHDGPEVWTQMIDNIRRASTRLKRNCKIAMDLGGPKIRTGPIIPGPRILRLRPERNVRGKVVRPQKLWIGSESPDESIPHLPVDQEVLDNLALGSLIYLDDARGSSRQIRVTRAGERGFYAECSNTTYLETGLPLYLDEDHSRLWTKVASLQALEQVIMLWTGDTLLIRNTTAPGTPAVRDMDGNVITSAVIGCTASEIFDDVRPDEPILFDDGKIEGVIRSVSPNEIEVEITYARDRGARLRADKGINLPNTKLNLSGLTRKDRNDLRFVVQHADVVNMSFVNGTQDVEELIQALKDLDAQNKIGVILKIETQSGYNNLTDILLRAMQIYPLGVMIARGDLAVECGWDNIGIVQEEILRLCQAAHVPDIWATQVLETLTKKGIPSRAEITDSAMAQRADCVMLNKGYHIVKSIKLLDRILKDQEPFQDKGSTFNPILGKIQMKEISRFEK